MKRLDAPQQTLNGAVVSLMRPCQHCTLLGVPLGIYPEKQIQPRAQMHVIPHHPHVLDLHPQELGAAAPWATHGAVFVLKDLRGDYTD